MIRRHYTGSVRAALLALCFAIVLLGQGKTRPQPELAEPPEEDLSPSEQRVYVLNPLQASKEIRIGNFYMKKGSFKAAAKRFDEAGKWNPGLAEAFLKLAEAQEKLGDTKAAHQAYQKFLELQPEGKQAAAIRKKLGKS